MPRNSGYCLKVAETCDMQQFKLSYFRYLVPLYKERSFSDKSNTQ